jgi:hypothetical protein
MQRFFQKAKHLRRAASTAFGGIRSALCAPVNKKKIVYPPSTSRKKIPALKDKKLCSKNPLKAGA